MSTQATAPQTPPPAAPEIQPQDPAQAASTTTPPPAAPRPSIENDPNHSINRLIAKRASRTKPAEPEKPAEAPQAPADPPKDNPKLGGLIAKALGFKEQPAKKVDKPDEMPAAPAKPAEAPAEPAKTIVKPKKAAAQAPDPVEIATKAATAAASAVAKTLSTPQKQERAAQPQPEDALDDEDRKDYEVARYLGESNPKYKGAEKILLDHVAKSKAYATRWEQQNPGKQFNPDDEEHNDFYASLEKPWSDNEFLDAKIEMAAERIAERKSKGSQAQIAELAEENARLELKPIADQIFNKVAAAMAKGLGDDVYNKIAKDGFDKFAEEDPITAPELAKALMPLQPLIETIIEIDDPKARIKLNMDKNPLHKDWAELLIQTENKYAGTRDESGRLFATRAEFAGMSKAERASRFYITADHLVAELVDTAVETVSERVKAARAQHEKIASRLGFVKPTAAATAGTASQATPAVTAQTPQAPATGSVKPQSPPDGGSPRIGAPATAQGTKTEKVLSAVKSVLFSR